MKRADVITNDNFKAGQVIVGFSSFGQAKYESEYNGGMGSNGLTSARHDVFHKALMNRYPETFDPQVPEELVYAGNRSLTEKVEGLDDVTVGQLVLSPTRTYAPIVKDILDVHRANIGGMIHCSGGAQTKVLHFAKGVHIIKDDLFDIPPLFKIIHEESGTDWKEMYKVFNMGHRLEVYIGEEHAQDLIDISTSHGVDAKIIGRVEASETTKLTIKSPFGEFNY